MKAEVNFISKRPRLKLDPPLYRVLHRAILERDRWRCQRCGSLRDLQVHHIQSRSLRGDDSEDNLITLCARCHQQVHLRTTEDSAGLNYGLLTFKTGP